MGSFEQTPQRHRPSHEDRHLRWPGLWEDAPETDMPVTALQGKIPRGIVGTLYKNGAGRRSLGRFFFDGDGMMRQLRFFEDGRAHYRSRYVQTPKYLAERNSDKPRMRTPTTQIPGGVLANIGRLPASEANTHAMVHAGKLWAVYEGGPPFELDPEKLGTIGVDNFGGLLSRGTTFSGHPHPDPNTGEVFNFGVVMGGARLKIQAYRLDPQGNMTVVGQLPLPFISFLHDFGLSQRWMCFPIPPMRGRALRMMLGLQSVFDSIEWLEGRTTRFELLSRDGRERRTFEVDPMSTAHIVAARDQGDEFVMDLVRNPRWDQMAPDLTGYRDTHFGYVAASSVWRYRMNLRTGRVQSEELSGLPSEYPRGNDARSIHAHRYSYLVVNPAEEMPGLHRAVQSLDLKTGQSRVFDFGVGHACQEPVFVPDPARTGQADNSGWLMGYVYDSSQRQTHCYIIDAQHVEDGPVCLLHMPSHVGFTFHGTWHPAPGGIQAG